MGHLVSSIEMHPDPHLVVWSESIDFPSILSIVGFIKCQYISSPKCLSKHTLLQTENKPTGKQKVKENKQVIKADACKADAKGTSFFELLLEAIANSNACAIVQLGDKRLAYIGVGYENTLQGLILGVLEEDATEWLKTNLYTMVLESQEKEFELAMQHEDKNKANEEWEHVFKELSSSETGIDSKSLFVNQTSLQVIWFL